jgi:hypothetical protein
MLDRGGHHPALLLYQSHTVRHEFRTFRVVQVVCLFLSLSWAMFCNPEL